MIIDTHCHLDFERFDADRASMIERARSHNVEGLILIGIDPQSWTSTRDLCTTHEHFWRAAGLHPNSVARLWNDDLENALEREAESGELVAIGETGVDLFRSDESRDAQMAAFDSHLRLAKKTNLPIVIHQRAAEDEVLAVLAEHKPISGVMHCFGGDWAFARKCLDLGLHLGIGGVSTYKNAESTRDAIGRAPEDRLVLETDAPFLAPQAVRGKRNEPAYLTYVVETIAEVRGVHASQVEEITTGNAVSLFGLTI